MNVFALLLSISMATGVPPTDAPPVEVFVPGAGFEQTKPPEQSLMIEKRWVTEVNTVELARNPKKLRLGLPSGLALDFVVRTFDPQRGFKFDDDGNAIPNEAPSELSYFIAA